MNWIKNFFMRKPSLLDKILYLQGWPARCGLSRLEAVKKYKGKLGTLEGIENIRVYYRPGDYHATFHHIEATVYLSSGLLLYITKTSSKVFDPCKPAGHGFSHLTPDIEQIIEEAYKGIVE